RRRFRAEDRELLAADSGESLLAAEHRPRQLDDALQDEVAAEVAEAVVESLEVVDVEKDQRERPAVAARASELPLPFELELAAVRDLSEAVQDDEVVDRLVIGVLDVALLKELEVHGADLEAVAAAEHGLLLDPNAVDVGPVGALQVLERDRFGAISQPGVM